MKQQYLRLFSFLIGVSFIISGVVYTFVNNYKKYKKEKLNEEIEIADKIEEAYKSFYDKEKELSTFRDTFTSDITEFSSYFENMTRGYSNIIKQAKEYEEQIIDIDDNSSYLKEVCNRRYSVLTANDKCDAYYINLEKSINLFIGDIEFFNSKIKEFNEWIEKENESVILTKKYEELEEYDNIKYKEYVDLNDDNTYLGKSNK